MSSQVINFSWAASHHADLQFGSDKLEYVAKSPKRPEMADAGECYARKKANKHLFMLRSCKRFGFDQNGRTVAYKSCFRPVIEFSIWCCTQGLPTNTDKQAGDLTRIQRTACRTIVGCQFTTFTESIKTV